MGKGHGGPAFTQTVKKYIDEGWEVFLISDEPSNCDYPYLDAAHNIFLSATPFKKYSGIPKLGLVFRYLDHLLMNVKFVQCGRKILDGNKNDTVLYAYEIFGVKACKVLSKMFSIPLVTRFQGTILSQYKNTWQNHIKRFPHYQALAEKSDLVIMTDDGTLGNKVLGMLENTSPVLFLRNGLELMERSIPTMKSEFNRSAFRARHGIADNETVFLTVSRLTGWKKVERAIDGFAEACRLGVAGKLVIVGDGDSRPFLEQRAKDLCVFDNVLFAGSVAHDEVYDYMMASDVFLSLYDLSNVGNPLLEAMTLGKCIVTLDVGDTCSLIHNRENGILLTLENLHNLGAVMTELAEDVPLRNSLGKAASDYAQDNFQTWKERMDKEFQAVSSLLT